MNDEATKAQQVEAPTSSGAVVQSPLQTVLGEFASAVTAALAEAAAAKVVERIWNRSAALWKDGPSRQKTTPLSLGCLTVPTQMQARADELAGFAAEVSASGD